jgi:thymidylate synthase
MRSIAHRNVNRAYVHAMQVLHYECIREESRNCPVMVLQEPLCTTVWHPTERVLFSRARKANCFFHLFESMWMLAGRSDAAFLDQWIGDFGSRFAEEDGHLHGAYGFRWRHHFGFDQLDHVVTALRKDPSSRRAVITMWDPQADLGASYRDIPCNVAIFVRIHPPGGVFPASEKSRLDLTISCRSNDVIWGLLGANSVHFSVLQEYLAWRLGCVVGAMHTLSNNCHVYDATADRWDPKEPDHDRYAREEVAASPLFAGCDPGTFATELAVWMEDPALGLPYKNRLFVDLLVPMAQTHSVYKKDGVDAACEVLPLIVHSDWRAAAELWLSQRKRRG